MMIFKQKKIRKRSNNSTIIILLLLALTIGGGPFYTAKTQELNIKNDVFWYTKKGLPINSQGGGIFKFIDPITGEKKYYWYGVHYKEADIYRNNPSVTQKQNTFESVTCYSSTDLVNWTFEAEFTDYFRCRLGRTILRTQTRRQAPQRHRRLEEHRQDHDLSARRACRLHETAGNLHRQG